MFVLSTGGWGRRKVGIKVSDSCYVAVTLQVRLAYWLISEADYLAN